MFWFFVALFTALSICVWVVGRLMIPRDWRIAWTLIMGCLWGWVCFGGEAEDQANQLNKAAEKREAARQNFHLECKAQNGRILDIGGKYTEHDEACISEDGRWLGEH